MHKLICIRMIVCYLHNVAQVKIFIYEEKSQQFNRLTIFSLFFYVSKYIHNETRRVVLKTVVMHNATECNLPNCSVDSVNKCINCCFRYITNFLYQRISYRCTICSQKINTGNNISSTTRHRNESSVCGCLLLSLYH